jgi:hypothetical protein
VCKLYLLFISADAAQEKEKKEKKVLLPTGASKSAAHTVLVICVIQLVLHFMSASEQDNLLYTCRKHQQ